MEKTQSADGTLIAFEKLGSGPPVILLGGAFCDHRARAAGLPLARAMAERLTVYAVDRRGRNESTDTAPYAVAREVEDVAALLQVAGGTAHVYGHSSGAVLALESALAGLPIQKLVLAEHRERVPEDLPQQLKALCDSGNRGGAAELFLSRAIGLPPPVVQQLKSGPAWPNLEGIAHTLTYDAIITADARGILQRAVGLTTPTLLLAGEQSQAWMRNGVQTLADSVRGARYETMPDQTHDVDPKKLGPLLADYFLS
jgi:pimeloyl-ACP methyl ester carboxylesterase